MVVTAAPHTRMQSKAGFVPQRTRDPQEAWRLAELDGTSILEGAGRTPAALEDGVRAMLGARLRAMDQTVAVIGNPIPGIGTFFNPETRSVEADSSVVLSGHADGYMSFGLNYPDVVFLLCETQAPTGGESFVVDGVRLLGELLQDRELRPLARFVWDVAIDQTRPGAVPHQRPIATYTPGGRLSVLRHEHQRLLESDAGQVPLQSLLDQWFELTEAAARAAPRYVLQPGDIQCMDNYRCFHGRDPFTGQRRLYKSWTWTDRAFGVPDVGGRRAAAGTEPFHVARGRLTNEAASA